MTGSAPSTGFGPHQTARRRWRAAFFEAIEAWLEAESERLALWLPVALGAGIALWFVLPGPAEWGAAIAMALAAATLSMLLPTETRSARALLVGGAAIALGVGLIWWRAERVVAPVLARPVVAEIEGRVEAVQALAARDLTRVTVLQTSPDLPPRVRINLPGGAPADVTVGATVRVRARLMPPPRPMVPGAFDAARGAWFQGLGAMGRALGPVTVVAPGAPTTPARERLSAHIRAALPGSAGGIAAALATGDQGGIADEDAEALRRAGLAHLLSVSGLHVTAVVGAAMLLALRLLALSPWLALRVNLRLIAAGVGAIAAVAYTWLAGMEVPTVRSCIAALLVLVALAMGREAITMRLVAAGALIVLLLWPEAITGPSFQLSFAAVAAIVALHEHGRVRGWLSRREEPWWRRGVRGLAGLLLTGFVVEFALMPIALYHFHRAGLYGAAANIVAIPLTTFVIMPLEAGALLLDLVGLGAPLWWLAGQGLALLLWLAHIVATAPGSITSLPHMPALAFAGVVLGGLWMLLWRQPARWVGLIAIAGGVLAAVLSPSPDLLVTEDGRHVAFRTRDGTLALLRERSGEYVQDTLGEAGGQDGGLAAIDAVKEARCNKDLCLVDVMTGQGRWRVLATRSSYFVDAREMAPLCAQAEIVISDRRLPRTCIPRWLKLDRALLAQTGGVAITLADANVRMAARPGAHHPWREPIRVAPPYADAGSISRSDATAPPDAPAP